MHKNPPDLHTYDHTLIPNRCIPSYNVRIHQYGGKYVEQNFQKPKRGRKTKIGTKMNETEENDVRDKRERLVACVLSGNSKQYLGKEYTEQQINEMDCNNVNTLLNRYESILSAQMTDQIIG